MKTSILAVLGLAACTFASPILDLDSLELLGNGILGHAADTRVFRFDYRVNVRAVPGQVVDSEGKKTGGLEGAYGIYRLGFNAANNVVCYNISHFNWRGQYESPANTATHLHEGAKGAAGPPRIAFPNPQGPNSERKRVGCLKGPFRTGLPDATTGKDTGNGFNVRRIINNPQAFFVDAHSSKAVPGAFRGQLPRKGN